MSNVKFAVWYMKPEHFPVGITGHADALPAADLVSTHTKVKDVEIEDTGDVIHNLEAVYQQMQGEIWSPNGEAGELIVNLGLQHTSMSVGDVIEHNGKYWLVGLRGFRDLTAEGARRGHGEASQA